MKAKKYKKEIKRLKRERFAMLHRVLDYEKKMSVLIDEPRSPEAERIKNEFVAQRDFAHALLFGERSGGIKKQIDE